MLNVFVKKKLYFLVKPIVLYYFFKQSIFYLKFNYFNELFKIGHLIYLNFFKFSFLKFKMFNYSLFSLFKNFIYLLFDHQIGFYVTLNMLGVGLFIEKCSASLFKFSLVSSHFVYMFLPQDIILKSSNNTFMLFGLAKSKVNNIVSNLLLLRLIGVYHLKGISVSSVIIFLKEGKKR